MPLRLERGRVLIAFANPLDTEAVKAVEFSTRSKVAIVVAPTSQIRAAIQHHFYFGDEISSMLANKQQEGLVEVIEKREDEVAETQLGEGKDKATVIRLVELLLVDGLRLGASDIHIEPGSDATPVRYRINGVLERGVVIPRTLHGQVVARIKVMATLDITERRRPQDGSIRVTYEDRKADVRVSVLPTQFGEKVVLRLLDPTAKGHDLEKIGLQPSELELLRREIRRPEGMILISGPTGSGKSTTAHSLLQDIVDAHLNIVTIENPIEHRLAGISQVEVNEKAGLGFADTLRSILRQDPDVIFVGEIRDAETARIALRAAQTGHLVVSTVHTIDATASITRLLDLGIDPGLISASLRLVIAQRLVRSLCPACKRPPTPPTELDIARLSRHGRGLDSVASAPGCTSCRDTGFTSRIGIFEILPVSRQLRAMLERHEPETLLRQQARSEGVSSMPAAAIRAINFGITTVDEVLRVVPPEESSQDASAVDGAGDPALRGVALAPPARPVSASAGALRVLVVDDDALIRKVLCFALKKAPIAVETIVAADGAEALRLCDQETIHMVLLDVELPDTSGFELCMRIRAHERLMSVPIFMLTGRGDVDAKSEAFRAGADDYLVKPIVPEELVARAVRALERNYGVRPTVRRAEAAAGTVSEAATEHAREASAAAISGEAPSASSPDTAHAGADATSESADTIALDEPSPHVAAPLPLEAPLPEASVVRAAPPPVVTAAVVPPSVPPILGPASSEPGPPAFLASRPTAVRETSAPPPASASTARQNAWSKFLGRSRPQ
jgi:type IV pilus assembly protein PilB